MLVILCLGAGWSAVGLKSSTPDATGHAPELLLQSGLAAADEAEITVIIWLKASELERTVNSLPPSGWNWRTVQYESPAADVATVAGTRTITRQEEAEVRDWYLALAQEIAKAGGQAYLDERIGESIDILAYMAKVQAMPQQWVFGAGTRSMAGYEAGFGSPLTAGSDLVNLQLLTRAGGQHGQTVLAIPVLLQEF